MATETKYQTPEEISRICRQWIQEVVPINFLGYEDSRHNGDLLHSYVRANGGIYSLAVLTEAAQHYKSNLHGLGVVNSAEYSAAQEKTAAEKAAAERLAAVSAEQDRVLNLWLRDHCPQGLKSSDGQPYVGDVDRIREFLNRNYGGEITVESLNDAVATLSNVLTWFSRKPEDLVIRGIKPKERLLSNKMLREAGMLPERLKGHVDDGKLTNPADLLKKITKKITGNMQDPWQTKCETLTVTNRYGRTNHGFLEKLSGVFAKNRDGSINWAETYKYRNAACDQYERTRNRD